MKRFPEILRKSACTLLYIAFIFAGFIFFWLDEPHSYLKVLDIKDPGRAALDASFEIIRFAVTLNSAILAGAATLSLKGADWIAQWEIESSLLVTAAMGGCALSYYGAYSAFSVLLEMSQIRGMDPANYVLSKTLAIQYYSALASAVILGLCFVRLLDRRQSIGAHTRVGTIFSDTEIGGEKSG